MRGIMAIALACLLSFTAPVFAADLEVPPLVTKEAPPIPPVVRPWQNLIFYPWPFSES